MDGLGKNRQNRTVRRRILWAVVVISIAAYLGVITWATSVRGGVTGAELAWLAGVVPIMLGAGLLMLVKRPENRIGELATWTALTMFVIPSTIEVATIAVFEQSGVRDWMWLAEWSASTLGLLGFVLLLIVVVVLPLGRIEHSRERWFIGASWASVVLLAVGSLFTNETILISSQQFVGVDPIPSPVFSPALAGLEPVVTALAALIYGLFTWAIALQVMRYRRASERERKQVRWVLFGGVAAIMLGILPSFLEVAGVVGPILHGSLGSMIIVPTLILFMGSIVIAVLEPPWADVDIVIRRSFVYGALSFVILLLYVGVAATFGVAAGTRLPIEMAIVLTVVIALLFQPARRRLQVVADRWVFGARPTKYEAVTGFGETLEQSSDPTELLPQLVETIQKALRLRWVSAWLDDGASARTGDDTGEPDLSVPIGTGEGKIGAIECGPKIEGSLDDGEIQLVNTLAGQVGMAVMNARLAGRIVTAAESERRRIERNIHDGAQQELVALVARLGMARAAARRGELTPEEIDDLQREARQILTDLRELAQGIHPSVLSDGGILEAVEERCTHLPLDVTVTAPPELRARRFEDDIEGAAYFFVTEALANVLKHADATSATISLEPDNGDLILSVSDDGRGFDAAHQSLNGLAGLRDRVQALGGVVTISSRPGRGTKVSATLPTE